MDSHEPMTRRRWRSLVDAAEDAARTAAAPSTTLRRAPASAVPLPRARRRASIRRAVPATS